MKRRGGIRGFAGCCLQKEHFRQPERKNIGWLQNFAMPISMFVAMGAAILIARVLPVNIAYFEFRAPIVS